MPRFHVKVATALDEWRGALAVRLAVFVDEQRVPADAEVDRDDGVAVHAVALLDGPDDAGANLLPARSGTADAERLAGQCVPAGLGGGDAGQIAPVIGTARLIVEAAGARIGRVAVLPAYRGLGIGAHLMRVLEHEAAQRGVERLRLHAQTHARTFYGRLGYAEDAPDVFDEDGIPHVRMSKLVRG